MCAACAKVLSMDDPRYRREAKRPSGPRWLLFRSTEVAKPEKLLLCGKCVQDHDVQVGAMAVAIRRRRLLIVAAVAALIFTLARRLYSTR